MGNLGSAIFEGEETPLRQLAQEHSKLWAFNGEIGGYGLSLADLELGEVAVPACGTTRDGNMPCIFTVIISGSIAGIWR